MQTVAPFAPSIKPGSVDGDAQRRFAVPATYLAVSGTDVFDEGDSLARLVEDLTDNVELVNEDLAVWRLAGDSARLVAVLRPGVGGVPLVSYL